jgi:hypothetical protein
VVFIPWRVGAEESGAANFGFGGAILLDLLGPPGRCSGCWPHDGAVAGGAVADFHFSDIPVRGDDGGRAIGAKTMRPLLRPLRSYGVDAANTPDRKPR